MALLQTGLAGCCTAATIFGFGNSPVADGGPRGGYHLGELEADLLREEQVLKRAGKALVVITLNSDQVAEDKLLRKLGYRHSRWMTKRQHPETKLRVYYKPLDTVVI